MEDPIIYETPAGIRGTLHAVVNITSVPCAGKPERETVEQIQSVLCDIYRMPSRNEQSEFDTNKKELLWYLQQNGIEPFNYLPQGSLRIVLSNEVTLPSLVCTILHLYRDRARLTYGNDVTLWRKYLDLWTYTRETFAQQITGVMRMLKNPIDNDSRYIPHLWFVTKPRRLGALEKRVAIRQLRELFADGDGLCSIGGDVKRELLFYLKRQKLQSFRHTNSSALKLIWAPWFTESSIARVLLRHFIRYTLEPKPTRIQLQRLESMRPRHRRGISTTKSDYSKAFDLLIVKASIG